MDEQRFAKLKSPLGETAGLLRLGGREGLSQPFRYEVDFLSTNPAIDFSKLLGNTMSVELELPDQGTRYFHGYVTELRLVGASGRYARYRAVLRPWLWLLTRSANCRVFTDKFKVANLVMDLFRERGFTDFENRLSDRSYRQWDYRVQYRESDFNFVSRLLEQEGIYYYFKHFANKHVLVLADDHGSHDTVPGFEQIPYYPPTDHEIRDRDHFNSWSMAQHISTGGYIADDFNFEMPKPGNLRVPLSNPDDYAFADYAVYDYPVEYDAHTDGERYARIRLEEHQAEHELFEGNGNVRALGAGALFTLEGFPREDQNREYLVVSSWYEVVGDRYESVSQMPPLGFHSGVTVIDSKRPFRPQPVTRKPKIEGPQTAIVVGEGDAEITTDPYGRVKVQFHWDRVHERNEKSSCWVRVAQLWAGSQFGAMHIPRVGQEVIVDFLEGDPDRPIIIGRVYNADNMPPYALPANKTQSGIKSRSTKGGQPNNFNELRFEDKNGQEELHMQAEKDMSTLVKHDRSASIGANDSTSVGGDRSVQVTGNLSVTVDGNGKSPIHSSHSVTGKYNLHASDTIESDAPTHIKLTCGGSSILIEPNKITLVAGGKALVVLDEHVLAQSSEGSKVVLDDNVYVEAKPGAQMLLDANVLAQSKASSTLLLDGDASIASKGDVKLGGANVESTGKQKVAANGGGAQVELTQAGATMAGAKVGINGSSMTEIMGAIVKIN
jgi:type VI secretion system secreted protein VgrG